MESLLEKIPDIIGYVFIGAIAIFTLLGVWRGFRRGLVSSALRLAFVVFSAIIATFLLKLVYGTATNELLPMLMEKAPETLVEVLDASPTLFGLIPALIEGLLGPILFVVIFIVALIATMIINAILNLIIKAIRGHKPGLLSRLGGIACAVVSSIIVALAILMPIGGYITHGAELVEEVTQLEEIDTSAFKPIADKVQETKGNKFVSLVSSLTDSIFMSASTPTMENGVKFDTYGEADTIIKMLPDVIALKDMDFSDLENLDVAPVHKLADDAGKSDVIRNVMAEILSTAGAKWYNNETFIGINIKEQLPEAYGSALDGVIVKFKNTTEATVIDDVHDIANTISSLAGVYAYMNAMQSGEASIDSLEDVLSAITPETVELITPVLSGDVLQEAGLNEQQAEVVSSVLTSALETIANLDEEEVAKEAEALNNIMAYATGAGEGTTDPDALIDGVMSSQAIKSAIVAYTETEGAKNFEFTPEQTTAIGDAITAYQTENSGKEGYDPDAIDAIKAIFGIE